MSGGNREFEYEELVEYAAELADKLVIAEGKKDGMAYVPNSASKYFVIRPAYQIEAHIYRKNYKDCLWYIAKKYYKNPRLWKKIYNFNREKIYNPNLIFPGWVIKVPKLKK